MTLSTRLVDVALFGMFLGGLATFAGSVLFTVAGAGALDRLLFGLGFYWMVAGMLTAFVSMMLTASER